MIYNSYNYGVPKFLDSRYGKIQATLSHSEDSAAYVQRLVYKDYIIKYLLPYSLVKKDGTFVDELYYMYAARLLLTDYGFTEHTEEDYEFHGQGD